MIPLFVVIGGGILLIAVPLAVAKLSAHIKGVEHSFVAATALLTKGELAFHQILSTVTPAWVCINAKVCLADIIKVTPSEKRSIARIRSKHVDFVLCDTATMRILCAIGLYDRSPDSESGLLGDNFVRSALGVAKVPYVEIKASRAYNSFDIEHRISPFVGI